MKATILLLVVFALSGWDQVHCQIQPQTQSTNPFEKIVNIVNGQNGKPLDFNLFIQILKEFAELLTGLLQLKDLPQLSSLSPPAPIPNPPPVTQNPAPLAPPAPPAPASPATNPPPPPSQPATNPPPPPPSTQAPQAQASAVAGSAASATTS